MFVFVFVCVHALVVIVVVVFHSNILVDFDQNMIRSRNQQRQI